MSRRFYPDYYPPFSHEPTKDKFKIITTSKKGEGIISRCSFEPGDLVFRFMGVFLEEVSLYTLQIDENCHIHDPFVMGKVLHSCDPNMICDIKTKTFYAVKPVRKGDFLTMDYETTEDSLYRSFVCECGSENCRGLIAGRKYRREQIKKIM